MGNESPDYDRLNYQVEKNNKYYSKFGWTSIGLSDGVLADKNYLLTTDLRKLTPFNLYHNPQRNLYSTLGMTGDELPRIRTKSMQKLIDRGITRTGWNMVTAVMDVPLNFEDQILVDKRHKGLSHTKDRRFIIYGNRLRVKIGDSVKYGQILGHSNDGQSIRMNLRCDSAKVVRIRKDWVETSGMRSPILVITVRAKRFLRDGTKFSNLHGNKGIVRFVDLGYAIDPRNGNEVPIDIMISAKSVNKRKNFGQILEALFNNTHEGTDPIVIEDDFSTEKETAQRALEDAGFPRDGVWHIDTFCGEYEAIVGRIFWGVTKDGEDATWEEDRTILTNNRELRTSGLKFSHVEMKALTTRFGPNNAIIKEILSHTQGSEILQDEIRVLKSAAGEIDKEYPVIDAKDIKTVDITKGLFHPVEDIKGTVVDDEYFPEGFTLQLPLYFQVLVNKNDHSQFTWGLPQPPEDNKEKFTEYLYNKIFIPNALLRRCWCHPSGNWGMNTLGAMINRIVLACHKYMENTESSFAATEVASAIGRYFSMLAKSMGTKKGELATYGMSVRYPFSVRGTAVLSENLPKDTVEIHTEMAKVLKVKNGDVIIAERFPCLGFVSIRPQFVSITDDPQCKHVIRVSGNSLVSMSLDFDGDTLFLASFFSPEAITVLREEMVNPNPICKSAIERINNNKVPIYSEMTIDDFEIHEFPRPTVEEHGELVRNAAGVKSHTGPVIALAYNLMRIVEANVPYENTEAHANLELLLDFLGNTVFKQKHGIKSLQEEATDAICCADVEKMVELGFERAPSNMLCELIRKEAASIRIRNLKQYHMEIAKPGLGAKVINIIVRKKHKLYFASRAQLGPFALLDHLKSPAVDLPSSMLVKILKSKREKIEDKIERLKSERMDAKADRMNIKDVLETNAMKRVYRAMSAYIDRITKKSTEVNDGL